MPPRIVFMGSPEFALPTLRGLAAYYPVAGVVTQPDRPAGRGRQLTPPPVKQLAQHLGIPVIQPQRLKEPEAMQQLQEWAPEVIVVAAFGQILRPAVLDLPPFGCVNVHASLLPRWRGAAPIQAAILHGDPHTGITIMRMDPGVDTGAILSQQSTPILPDDTAGSLAERLAELGAGLLLETLPAYLNGTIQPQPQDDSLATYAPMLKKEDGQLDFSQPADVLARLVRAFHPWPGAFTTWEGQALKILRAHAVDAPSFAPGTTSTHAVDASSNAPGTTRTHAVDAPSIAPGTTRAHAGLPALGCSAGLLVLDEVQPAGKRPMPGEVFLRGAKNWGSLPAGG